MPTKTKGAKSAKKSQLPRPKKAATGPGWNFIHQNPHDSSFYNNAAIYATPETVKSLVRETTQNSLDAGVEEQVTVRYTLYELPRKCDRYKKLITAIDYASGLKPHIAAAAHEAEQDSDGGVRLSQGLNAMEAKDSQLRVLVIEDFGASGLSGDEHGKHSAFSALVRDQGHSDKGDQTSGGSHGVGSKTLFGSSQIMTVFFASLVKGEEDSGIRLIGKTDISVHHIHQQMFAGRGWWGDPLPPDGAESLWPADEELLRDLLLNRDPPTDEDERTGSSMMILAFSEVEADDEAGETVIERIKKELAENFWPSMIRGQLRAEVRLFQGDEDEPSVTSDVDPEGYVPSLIDAYNRHLSNELAERLELPGDTVSVPVTLRVPATTKEGKVTPQHQELASECRLLIRLAEPDKPDGHLIDRVGYTRGRGMITQYSLKRNIAAGARSFHAVLLAGKIVDDSAESDAAERFLRFSEPAAHNEWSARKGLRYRYGRHAGARIAELQSAIVEQLRKYVCAAPTESDEGPDSLKQIFRISVPPGPGKDPIAVIKASTAPFEDGRYNVSATITHNAEDACRLRPKLFVASESLGSGILCTWESLTAPGTKIRNGMMHIPKGKKKIELEGVARVAQTGLDPALCAVNLVVDLLKD